MKQEKKAALLEQWINGNRKDVVRRLAPRRLAVSEFALALARAEGLEDAETFLRLVTSHKEGVWK